MAITIEHVALRRIQLHTRMPFHYGIASLTTAPHLFLVADFNIDGTSVQGIAADTLPPKWFTKNPTTRFEDDDLPSMLAVINHAREAACDIRCYESIFTLWQQVYHAQRQWAESAGYPPLLWNFGVSLIERAAIDAFCKVRRLTFHHAVACNAFGIELGALHEELADYTPADLLPNKPASTIGIRHTVGQSDPLTNDDLLPGQQLTDGLPVTLADAISTYGLQWFKIKLTGNSEHDILRLRNISRLLKDTVAPEYRITLDGNEQFHQVDDLAALWQRLENDKELRPLMERVLFLEQPLHRTIALSEATGKSLNAWTGRPPIIIDESDATIESLPLALSCGYAGTSHKNCKGVIKGIAGACLIVHRRMKEPQSRFILSGEDLVNIGPVALLEDLAVAATFGLDHVERNGHHYFRGLSTFPENWQEAMLAAHGDLYTPLPDGTPSLNIVNGRIDLTSINASPFGCRADIDPMELP